MAVVVVVVVEVCFTLTAVNIRCVSENDIDMEYYNFDLYWLISIIFRTNVAEVLCYQALTCFATLPDWRLRTTWGKHAVMSCALQCANLNTIRQRFFGVSSLKDLLDNIDNQIIIDFVKETHFYARVQCLLS